MKRGFVSAILPDGLGYHPSPLAPDPAGAKVYARHPRLWSAPRTSDEGSLELRKQALRQSLGYLRSFA